jgi:hypothetical protein
MAPYTPFRNGSLIGSVTLGTKIGSGELHQIAPYSRFLYHGKLMVSSITGSPFASKGEKKILTDIDLKYYGGPTRGAFWFERMKEDHKEAILKGAQEIANRGV